MANPKTYGYSCPIARALDRIGDRWTLLIIRDLHAGPARYSDLQESLQGIAPNLLSSRLQQLSQDGLVLRHKSDFGVTLYQLTEMGRRTNDLLFELAMFGEPFPFPDQPRRPGNVRSLALTLRTVFQRVVEPNQNLNASLIIDDQYLNLVIEKGRVRVNLGQPHAPDVILTTNYDALIAVFGGRMSPSDFAENYVKIDARSPDKVQDFITILSLAIALTSERAVALAA